MKTKTALLSTAIGSLLALSLTTVSAYAATTHNMEKCYGVAKAGKKRLRWSCACLCRTVEGELWQGMDQSAEGHLRTHRRRKFVRQVMTMASHDATRVQGRSRLRLDRHTGAQTRVKCGTPNPQRLARSPQ